MKTTEVIALIRTRIAEQFPDYEVTLSRQSRVIKPELPLITLTPGNIRRPQAPNYDFKSDGFPGYYLSRIPIVIDLFTHGEAVYDDNDGTVVGYFNSAVEELVNVLNYLNSNACVEWCGLNDISILIEGEIQDITGIVNDSNYEYRARQEVGVYFTQEFDSGIGFIEYVSAIEENNELILFTDDEP